MKKESKKKAAKSSMKEKIKSKAKSLVSKIKSVKPAVRRAKPARVLPSARTTAKAAAEKEIIAQPVQAAPAQEQQQTQYYAKPFPSGAPTEVRVSEEEKELPSGYGDNRIVLMVRDPYWTHAYWEITGDKKGEVEKALNEGWGNLRKVLRVYDVTGKKFDGTNANSYYDIDITDFANNWYINVGAPDRSWCVELGAIDRSGRFYVIARSNIVSTPRDTMSWITDEEWMIVDADFRKLYALSGGLMVGLSSAELRKKMMERLRIELASGGVSSLFSPGKRIPGQKQFWLVVNTELIVYGATEPDANVTVQGKPIKLNHDGTFSLRFALPDGEQVIPVKAVSNDGTDSRQITPIVRKETK